MLEIIVLLLCLLALAPAIQSQESPSCLIEPSRSEVDSTLIDVLHTVHERFSIRQSQVTQDSRTVKIKGAIIVDASSGQSGNGLHDRRMTSDELMAATFPELSFTCLLTAQQRVGASVPASEAVSMQGQTESVLPESSLPDNVGSQSANQPAGQLASVNPGTETSPAMMSSSSVVRGDDDAVGEGPTANAETAQQSTATGPQQGGSVQPQKNGQNAQPSIPGDKGDRVQYDVNGHAIQNANTPPDYGQQPKRIMGWIPNFRAVSAGTKPPPPSFKEKFMISTSNSFDYAAIIFNAVDSEFPYILKSYPQFGNGLSGYGDYYWHGFVDKTIGSYMSTTLVPTLTCEDTRYYELGTGHWYVRAIYAYTRVLITPNDAGRNTFNFSEIVGRGAAAGLGNLYYPASDISWTKTGQRWLVQVAIRDGGFAVFREFWPDISKNILHLKPKNP